MPTYNFKSNGEIEIDGVVKQTIEGPAVLSPRSAADTFYLIYLNGNDLYYYSTNTYQIDGEEFEGSLAQFCVAASALYESTGGGGESYPDITDNVSIAISATKSFSIVDDDGKGLIAAAIGTTDKAISLGDPDGLITTGPTSSVYVMRDSGSDFGTVALNSNFDGFNTQANISVTSNSADTSFIKLRVDTSTISGWLMIDNTGFAFTGNGPVKFENTGGLNVSGVVEYADNAAAITGGLVAGNLYRTGDVLKIVHA